MQEKTNENAPSPVEPGTQETTTPENNTAEVATSKDEAGASDQVAPASADSPEATAPRPAQPSSYGQLLNGSEEATAHGEPLESSLPLTRQMKTILRR